MKIVVSLLVLSASAGALAQPLEDGLFETIDEGKPLVAKGIVALGGVKLDARNSERETLLHVAVLQGDSYFLDLLRIEFTTSERPSARLPDARIAPRMENSEHYDPLIFCEVKH